MQSYSDRELRLIGLFWNKTYVLVINDWNIHFGPMCLVIVIGLDILLKGIFSFVISSLIVILWSVMLPLSELQFQLYT